MLVLLAFFNPFAPIATFLGQILTAIDAVTHSLGWSLVIFAALVKLALWPLSQMQFKSMAEMQRVAPLMKALQAKYKSDPKKLNEEMMALYKEHGVNPMAGCLPMLIQLPILFSLYTAIQMQKDNFAKEGWLWIGSADTWLRDHMPSLHGTLANILPAWVDASNASGPCPSSGLSWFQTCTQAPVIDKVKDAAGVVHDVVRTVDVKDAAGVIHHVVQYTHTILSHYVFAPDLAKADMLLLALYVISMYFSVRYGTAPASDPAQAQQQKMMAFISPVMIAFIGRGWQSALIVYWLFFNAFSLAQSFYLLRKYGVGKAPAVASASAVPASANGAGSTSKRVNPSPKASTPNGATGPRKKRSRR